MDPKTAEFKQDHDQEKEKEAVSKDGILLPPEDVIATRSNDVEEDKTDDQEKKEEAVSKDKILLPPLDIIKTNDDVEGEKAEEPAEDDDGFKTPTGLEHRIPMPLTCPPAPRKPKQKRKAYLCYIGRTTFCDESISSPRGSLDIHCDDLGANAKKSRK